MFQNAMIYNGFVYILLKTCVFIKFFDIFDTEMMKTCVFIDFFDFFDFLGLSNVAGLLWGRSAALCNNLEKSKNKNIGVGHFCVK